MERHSSHFPRILVTPSLRPVSARAAVPPRAQMALGAMAESWRYKKLAADFHLVRFGSAVAGRPALHHVADVDVFAAQLDALFLGGALDHLREQLTGAPDEWDALRVFVGARAFADEHQRRTLIADTEDYLVAPFVQAAAAAIADIFENARQGVAARRQRRQVDGRLLRGRGRRRGYRIHRNGFRLDRLARSRGGWLAVESLHADILIELEAPPQFVRLHGRRAG